MDRNATRQASGGGEIGCAPAGKASTHAAPWAPCTISGNRSIPRRPTPCARRSTTPGGTWRHRATFSAHGFRLIGRANGSPSASPTWCNVANAIPTISPRMRSTIWRDELHHEDNGVETRLCPVKPVPSRYHDSATDGLCLHRKGARDRPRGRSMFRFQRNRARFHVVNFAQTPLLRNQMGTNRVAPITPENNGTIPGDAIWMTRRCCG